MTWLAWIALLPWFVPDRPIVAVDLIDFDGRTWSLVSVESIRDIGPMGLEVELVSERPDDGFGRAPILFDFDCYSWGGYGTPRPDPVDLHYHAFLHRAIPCGDPVPDGRFYLFAAPGVWRDPRAGNGGGAPCKAEDVGCGR